MKLSKAILASAVISVTSTAALAQEATGTVTKIDEQKGTISIELAQGGTVGGTGAVQEFKAQDRLLFNELRPGDKVLFRVFEADGAKTITRLDKENVSTPPSAQNSGAGIAGKPGSKSGPVAKPGTIGQGNPTVQQQDSAKIPGLPGNKSGPPEKQPSRR
jgi:Cu/Ag efflux protein CusF